MLGASPWILHTSNSCLFRSRKLRLLIQQFLPETASWCCCLVFRYSPFGATVVFPWFSSECWACLMHSERLWSWGSMLWCSCCSWQHYTTVLCRSWWNQSSILETIEKCLLNGWIYVFFSNPKRLVTNPFPNLCWALTFTTIAPLYDE